MTLFEALKFNREPLEMLFKMGMKQDDARYIDLYSEFETMKSRGEKDYLRRTPPGRKVRGQRAQSV